MKLTKTLSALLIALVAIASGAVNANSKNAPIDGVNNASIGVKVGFEEHRKNSHRHKYSRSGNSGMKQQLFSQIDANGDGTITQEEVDAFRAAKVSAADLNNDGALSLEEFETIYNELTRQRMVRAFQNLDTDGDGIISTKEMDARFGAIVKQMEHKGSRRN